MARKFFHEWSLVPFCGSSSSEDLAAATNR